jgi:hypothetical protein
VHSVELTYLNSYKSLSFTIKQERRINFFFLTILGRKDLAKNIKRFKLINDEGLTMRTDAKTEFYYHTLLSRMCDIRDTIYKISASSVPTEFQMRWVGGVFKGWPCFYGALAIILCLATNIETLSLSSSQLDSLPITLGLLGTRWNQHVDCPPGTGYPFSKLKDVRAYGRSIHAMPLLPPMQKIYMRNCSFSKTLFFSPFLRTGMRARLRTVVLHDVSIDPATIEEVLRYGELQTLKHFVVNGNTYCPKGYDFRRITAAFEQHIPEIEEIEWARQYFPVNAYMRDLDDLPTPFKTFKNLKNLKSLRLDLELLNGNETSRADRDMVNVLVTPRDLFPPSLQHLDLASIEMEVVDDLWKEHAKEPEHHPEALQFVINVVASSSIKKLDLSVLMETWCYDGGNGTREWQDEPLELLRLVADELDKFDIDFRVIRQLGHAKHPQRKS